MQRGTTLRAARAAIAWLAITGALLLGASAASASSLYAITSGEVKITISAGGVFLADPLELEIDGSSIEVDLTPGSEQIVSLEVTTTGSAQVVPSQPLGSFDAILVDALRITGGPGALFPLGPLPPVFEYAAQIEDVVLDVSFMLIDGVTVGPQQTIALPLGLGVGSLFVDLVGPNLTLSGIVEESFQIDGFGPITIKADLNLSAVIPEPTAALVFAVGLLPVARAARRRRAARR